MFIESVLRMWTCIKYIAHNVNIDCIVKFVTHKKAVCNFVKWPWFWFKKKQSFFLEVMKWYYMSFLKKNMIFHLFIFSSIKLLIIEDLCLLFLILKFLFPIITHVLYMQSMQYLCTCMHITCHALNHIYSLRDIVVCQVSPRHIFGNFTI